MNGHPQVLVCRQVSYYAYKIVLPLLLITSLVFGAYVLPGSEISGRLSLVVGVFFTVVSFLRLAERNIPMVRPAGSDHEQGGISPRPPFPSLSLPPPLPPSITLPCSPPALPSACSLPLFPLPPRAPLSHLRTPFLPLLFGQWFCCLYAPSAALVTPLWHPTSPLPSPQVPYHTLLDRYIISCIGMIWLVFLELSASALLPYDEEEEAASSGAVDMDGVKIPPGVTGQTLDLYFGGALAVAFALLNLWAVGVGVALKRKWAEKNHEWGVKERKEARRAKRKVAVDEEKQQRVPFFPFFN